MLILVTCFLSVYKLTYIRIVPLFILLSKSKVPAQSMPTKYVDSHTDQYKLKAFDSYADK